MRILHTADWHFGRTLEGRSRQQEKEQFVDELCQIVRQESVDLVLIAGDVFDTYNPPAAAEELYCDALDRLGDGGRRAVVVIAGNHDSPDRLCAVRSLAQRQGVTLFGYPADQPPSTLAAAGQVQRVAAGPGWVELAVPGVDHSALVLALPYPSESRLNEVLEQTLDEAELQVAYSERVGRLFAGLARHYRPDTVRLAVSHLFVAGGQECESERPIQVGGTYTVAAGAMPVGAQYVGLGHLHRPQRLHSAPVPTRYAGSPLAYSFSEAGQAKSVTIVDLLPDTAAPVVQEIPLTAGRPLVRWHATAGVAQVQRWVEEGRDPTAWIDLAVTVPSALTLDEIQTLRRLHPGFIHIRPVYPEAEVAATREQRVALTLAEQFERFYRQRSGGGTAPAELTRLFLELAMAADEAEVEQ